MGVIPHKQQKAGTVSSSVRNIMAHFSGGKQDQIKERIAFFLCFRFLGSTTPYFLGSILNPSGIKLYLELLDSSPCLGHALPHCFIFYFVTRNQKLIKIYRFPMQNSNSTRGVSKKGWENGDLFHFFWRSHLPK